jgi:hypothetical protein
VPTSHSSRAPRLPKYPASVYLDQLKDKIRRSQVGRARRGIVAFTPPLGIKLAPKLDAEGKPIVGDHGKVVTEFQIDEQHVGTLRLLKELFVDRRWSAYRIAKHFNRVGQSGKRSWTASTVYDLLDNYLYVGIAITNRYTHYYDPRTGTFKTAIRPRSEWRVKRVPQVRVWSWKEWKAIRARRKELSEKYGPRSRNGHRHGKLPTTCLSGVLERVLRQAADAVQVQRRPPDLLLLSGQERFQRLPADQLQVHEPDQARGCPLLTATYRVEGPDRTDHRGGQRRTAPADGGAAR